MIHTFEYQNLWDATLVNPVVVDAALDSIRTSLNNGHTVRIILLDDQEPLLFTDVDAFEQWVSTL